MKLFWESFWQFKMSSACSMWEQIFCLYAVQNLQLFMLCLVCITEPFCRCIHKIPKSDY